MKKIIITLMASLALQGMAIASPKMVCHEETITICQPVSPPHRKPHRHPHKRPVRPAPESPPVIPTPPVMPPVVVPVTPPHTDPVITPDRGTKSVKSRTPDSALELHLGVGLGVRDPYISGLIGLRYHRPDHVLGVELYSQLNFGVGVDLLFYLNNNWHLDAGMLYSGGPFSLISVDDVPRDLDVSVGAGYERRLNRNVSLTMDWRWRMPNPIYIVRHNDPIIANGQQVYGPAGRYLDVGNVVQNSLTESQVIVGVLLRW